VPAIACVSPVETAADKLSALTWRVLTRQRGGARDEPALIRHLHDLAALETLASEHPEFPELLLRLLVQDAARGRAVPEIAAMTPGHRLAAALNMLAAIPTTGPSMIASCLVCPMRQRAKRRPFKPPWRRPGALRN